VKYNLKDGHIIIELSLQKINEINFLVTKIEDSGKGIEEERIEYLFKPFSELKNKECL
jgi:signal transduction histidine kinase